MKKDFCKHKHRTDKNLIFAESWVDTNRFRQGFLVHKGTGRIINKGWCEKCEKPVRANIIKRLFGEEK